MPLAGTWGTNRYSLIQLGINALAAQAAQQAAETVFAGLEAEMAADAGRGSIFFFRDRRTKNGNRCLLLLLESCLRRLFGRSRISGESTAEAAVVERVNEVKSRKEKLTFSFISLSKTLQRRRAGEPYHGLLFNGDLNYARGEQMQWANWFSQGAKVFG